ncbi:MAG TPA: hypothetical protein VK181_04670, partial [Rhizobium sp.]|nr:hypothetical protein [Rhizobium sp.]
APFVLGGAVLAWGSWIYTQKIRSIGVRAWAAKRSEEVAKTRALNKPLAATPPKTSSSSATPDGRLS